VALARVADEEDVGRGLLGLGHGSLLRALS
jgi:hypothetical protein